MLGKHTRFLIMVAAALGIPYVWFNENVAVPLKNAWKSFSSDAGFTRAGRADTGRHSPSREQRTASSDPLAGSASSFVSIQDLPTVLRFDVTPRWITQRWQRVSTVHAQPELEGFRVPLVTGTNPHDITGSLTYYFDREQRVRRITLHGHTGDERVLIAVASQRFGLKPESSRSAGMYVMRWNGKPINVLRICHAPVIRATPETAKLLVELEVNDLSAGFGLSSELRQTLLQETLVRGWGD